MMHIEKLKEIKVANKDNLEKLGVLSRYKVVYTPRLISKVYYIFATDENDAENRCFEDHHHYEDVYEDDCEYEKWGAEEANESGEYAEDFCTFDEGKEIKWEFPAKWKREDER